MSEKNKRDLKYYYDLEADERNAGSMDAWKLKLRSDFLSLIQAENKTSLLEIGAGPGKDSKFFSDNGQKVVAIDLSTAMVQHCREKGIEAYELDFANVTALGRKFDSIWAMNTLLHLEKTELPQVLSLLDCVLNPNGLFFMGVYGGTDKEDYRSRDIYPVPRFFSSFSDESLKSVLLTQFDIVKFDTIDMTDTYHFQSIVMRKKSDG